MEKLEFMKSGRTLAANMTQPQKIEFMRNRGVIIQQTISPIPTEAIETKPIAELMPLVEEQRPLEKEKVENVEPVQTSLSSEDISIDDDLISYAIKLSLDDNKPLKSTDPSPLKDEKPQLNEIIQRINNVPGKNIVINYNVTIKQKVKNSTQNINIGKNNSNY